MEKEKLRGMNMRNILILLAALISGTANARVAYQVNVMPSSGNLTEWGAIDLSQSASHTGILPNANTTADSANTASAIVARDASGNFSAGTISAALSGNASTATKSTNLAGGLGGEVCYQSAVDTTAFLANGTAGQILQSNGTTLAPSWVNASGGTVTAVSVASANGFAGSSSGGATPALTLSTSITGMLKGDGTAISAGTSGTDYSAGTSALATGILKSTTTTGALSIAVAGDFPTLNQNTTGNAATSTALAANPTDCGAGTKAISIDASGNLTCSAVALSSDVSGALPIANGGTGQTTASAAFDALAPSQTSNSGKYLTTNGTTTSWATVAGGSSSASKTFTLDGVYSGLTFPLLNIDTFAPFDAAKTISSVWVWNGAAGSSGTTEFDIKMATTSGGAFTTIFSTTGKIASTAAANVWTDSGAVIGAQTGVTKPVLSTTSVPAGAVLKFDLITGMGGSPADCGIMVEYQ